MRSHRLSRLALLTQGVALVGFGLSELACSKDPPPASPGNEPPHVNAPPETPPPSPKHVNAPEGPLPDINGPKPSASASAAPSASASPSVGKPPGEPKHVNSPPTQKKP